MVSLLFGAPLNWPTAVAITPRAQQRKDNGFAAMTLPECLANLEQELTDFQCKATLYLDIEQPLVDRLRKKVGSRTGAALNIRMHGSEYIITCDRWLQMEHNIYSIYLTLRQWLNMERWGIGTLPQLLHGFNSAVLREQSAVPMGTDIPECMEEMGLGATSTLDDAIAVYHRRAKSLAQDTQSLARLNILMEEIRSYFATRSKQGGDGK